MRWSRNHTGTSLGELMDAQPDTSVTCDAAADQDTQVRLRTEVRSGEPATSPETVEPDDDAPGANDGFLDNEDYLPQERRGPGRLTIALVAALVLAVGVLGGVWVEKQLGSGQSSAAAGGQGMRGGSAGGQGMPGGSAGGQGVPGDTASGAAGGSGMPGGGASALPGGTSGGAGTPPSSGSGSGTSTTPVVVGTVSSAGAKSLVVADLGGAKHTVTVSSTTTVTMPYGHASLKTGDTVAVSGSTASDGSVAATGVTVS